MGGGRVARNLQEKEEFLQALQQGSSSPEQLKALVSGHPGQLGSTSGQCSPRRPPPRGLFVLSASIFGANALHWLEPGAGEE